MGQVFQKVGPLGQNLLIEKIAEKGTVGFALFGHQHRVPGVSPPMGIEVLAVLLTFRKERFSLEKYDSTKPCDKSNIPR